MSNAVTKIDENVALYEVVHPLFDKAEEKCDPESLGLMEMSVSVRVSLFVLRLYLVAMAVMLGYHILDLAGFLGHVAKLGRE